MTAFGWSVGDIVAGISLIITSIDAVKDSTGSAAEYRAVSSTLVQVVSTLEGLNKLKIEDAAERHALHASASKCGETVFQFVDKIAKFKPGLGTHNSFWKLDATLRKIEWALYTSKDLHRFHTQLLADLATLNVTLVRVMASLSNARAGETQSALIRIEKKLDHNIAIHLLLVQALQHCFSEFRSLLVFIFMGNMQLISLLFSDPSMVQVPEETPIYIDDPNRRILKFLRSSIRDWGDFETLLKMQFKREAGLQKISAGEYALHDPQRNTDITKTMVIERVFLPGKKLAMSIVFKFSRQIDKCPRCPGTTGKYSGLEMKCNDCGLTFSKGRITDKNEHPQAPLPPFSIEAELSRGTAKSQHNFRENSRAWPVPPPDSIHDFTRVRIIENLGKAASWDDIWDIPDSLSRATSLDPIVLQPGIGWKRLSSSQASAIAGGLGVDGDFMSPMVEARRMCSL
jgi:hypothetical protein